MLNKINIDSNKQIMIVYIILIVATLAVYWQVNQHDFINLDDPVYVTENSHIRSGITLDGVRWAFSTTYAEFWHPLTWLSLLFDYQLHGLNAGGYHLTNLILHIMSALLLFWLFNRMTGAIWRSAFVAALFALHPLHVESVAWIAERKDVLSAFFWMLTLCLYVYYTEKPVTRRYLLVLLCFACGLMSKSIIVTLPIVMILLDYWPLGRFGSQKAGIKMTAAALVSINSGRQQTKSRKGALKKNISPSNVQKLSETKIAVIIPLWQLWEKIPLFVLSAVFVIITLYAQYKPSFQGFPLDSRIANAPVSFVTYLMKTFWPHDLAVFYPFSDQLPVWQVLGATLLIIVISAVVLVTVKRLPYLFVGWLWYAITLLPVIGIIQVGDHAMADRYTYLPLIGIGIMLAWGMPFLIKRDKIRKIILFPAGFVFISILSFLTWQQCVYWKNSLALFNHVLQATKDNYLAHNNLGAALSAEGKNEEAIAHYLKAIEINPYNELSCFNLVSALVAQGRIEEAIAAIKINPNQEEAHLRLGVFWAGQGKKLADQGKESAAQRINEEAIAHYLAAIKINPDQEEAHFNLGVVLAAQGKYEEAITHYLAVIKIDPTCDSAYYNLANLLMKQGKIEEAVDSYRKTIKINPDHADAHCNLADVFVKQNKVDQAIEHFREAVRINPSSFTSLNNLGVNLESQLKHDEAIYYYRKALLIEPQNPGLHFNMGVALGNKGELKEAIENFRQAINLKPDYQEARRVLKLAIDMEKK